MNFLVRLKGKKLMLVGDSVNQTNLSPLCAYCVKACKIRVECIRYIDKKKEGRGYFVFKFLLKVYVAYLVYSNLYALIL